MNSRTGVDQLSQLRAGLEPLIEELLPGSRILTVEPLGPDTAKTGVAKAEGYTRPLCVSVQGPDGRERVFVFRMAAPNEFGHDRRADRAEAMLLAYDTFPLIPRQVQAIDIGFIRRDGRLQSLRSSGEFYLLTGFANGQLYSEDLRRIAREGAAEALDLERCKALARYAAGLHASKQADHRLYRRAIRDLLGHGEGIFGIIDSYPDDAPGAPPARLQAIEARCLDWRWRLRAFERRVCRTHGDFHPFNVVFGAGVDFSVLDASRGCVGDPADDVSAMAINYIFFALDKRHAWKLAFQRLWRQFWQTYLEQSGDSDLPKVVAPFFAWRALVIANPRFYPGLGGMERDALLRFAEKALDRGHFDLELAEVPFA
jgi:hypothetical protein